MKHPNRMPEATLAVVLEGFRRRPVGDICADHEISLSQYDHWRDQFFDGGTGRS